MPSLIATVFLPILDETIVFLLIAVAVALLSKRLRSPYTIGLVLMGIVVGVFRDQTDLFSGEGHFELTREVILLVFLPPLLFEGAMNIQFRSLREGAPIITTMAILGTLGSVLLIGGAARWLIGWDWDIALLFGVIASPTDPVSVLAIFREQGVEKRLSVMVEGESLFNDGLSVVLYGLLLVGIEGGWEGVGAVPAILTLGRMVLFGAAIGIALGLLTNRILERIDDHLIEVLISVVLAYGSYLLAEHLHCSGVIAVVFSGLLMGNVGRRASMSPTTLVTINLAWEVVAFLANSLVFLAMGLALLPGLLLRNALPVVALFLASVVARSLVTYGLGGLDHMLRGRYPWRWLHVLNWGGLKGTIPVALALGLSGVAELSGELEELQALVFGVVLLSLLAQGLTIKPLLGRLGLTQVGPGRHAYEREQARAIALEAAIDELGRIHRRGEIPEEKHRELEEELRAAQRGAHERQEEILARHPELAGARERAVMEQLLQRQRTALDQAYSSGAISEHALQELQGEIDRRLIEEEAAPFGRPADAPAQADGGEPQIPETPETPETPGRADPE
ncbi:MAG: Na+/H+ antiporter [Planctomycetota bacterium]